jgi:hypothetical protein
LWVKENIVALNLLEYAQVDLNTVVLKFGRTIKISSLVNKNFTVQTDSATPSVISGAFQTINTITDYNQISRSLILYWDKQLAPNTSYIIRVSGFLDAANELIDEEQVLFTKTDDATPSSFSSIRVPEIQEVLIEDHSIRADAYTSVQIIAKNPNFYINSVDPHPGAFYLENEYNSGRAIVTFSSRPASNFLSNTYFKAQRKKIQRAPSRWQNIETRISMHSWKPEVYIDFPSNDSTPVYFFEDKTYFESGYKYRIIVSKDVGI